jgi:hypothetical protein
MKAAVLMALLDYMDGWMDGSCNRVGTRTTRMLRSPSLVSRMVFLSLPVSTRLVQRG